MFINRVKLLWHCSLKARSRWHNQLSYCSIGLLSLSSVLAASPAWSSSTGVSHSTIDRLDETVQAPRDVEIDAEVERREVGVEKGVVESNPRPSTLDPRPSTLHTPHLALDPQYSTLKTLQRSTSEPPVPFDLDPNRIEGSPVLKRWLKRVPNVLADIKGDPSFRTRLRLGYSQFPSTKQAGGIHLGIEDVFAGRSGLTLSADYETAFNGKREAWGLDWRYYVRPLGSAINAAPVIGYRYLETTRYSTNGVHVGLRLLLVPSRTGATDLAVTQSWVAPGSENEVGLTTLSFGYALTHNLRLSTDIQKQNSRFRSDSRVGIGLEWMF